MAFEIKVGESVQCIELITGRRLGGTFVFSDDEISTSLYSFDGEFSISTDDPVFLLTAKASSVTLYSNISGGLGRTFSHGRAIYNQQIFSNTAVIGPDPWVRSDRIRRVGFGVPRAKSIMRHHDRVERISAERLSSDDDLCLFSFPVGQTQVGAGYGVSYSMDSSRTVEIEPRFELEFGEGLGIDEYIDSVHCYLQFLSFAIGVRFSPSAIDVCRLSAAEHRAKVVAREYPGDHRVVYMWPQTEVEERDLRVGGTFVSARDDTELAAMQACIHTWFQRYDGWRDACNLMMGSLKLRDEIGGHRLLAACRWLEQIPIAAPQRNLDTDKVSAIIEVATAKAVEVGLSNSTKRIAGALKRLREESHEERFARLVDLVRSKFGQGIMPPKAVEHLSRAIWFRGRSAHGHFEPADEEEHKAFDKSVFAVEALCLLLTACDLPLSPKGIEAAARNRVIQDYRLADE